MPDLIGKTLGPYRIVSQIGLGGMATVYKAYQPSMDRYVALKVLSTHLAQDPAFLKRFEQEARIIAKLEHLNILPVYDHGEQDGYLYLVMRYIEAGTLTDRLKQGRLSLEQVRRVVTQVGSALEYAHQLGVVHRDVKPSNVLVDPQGDCYLTDFGIARMVEGTLGLTGSSVIGTPHYMAPEQSKSRQVDHRADIYAMGVVIYEMITGRVPYDAETPFAVVMMHLTEPLPLPRSIRPDLPEGVERVILKALAKDPSERYQSMRDLVVAFDEAVRQAPAFEAQGAVEEPMPPPTLMRGVAPAPAWKRWLADQPPWLLPAAGLALIVLIVAGVILSRIPGRVEISGGQVQLVTPTVTTETAQAVVPALMPTAEAAQAVAPLSTVMSPPQPTAMPTWTAAPASPCRIAYTDKQAEGDIYIQDCDGSHQRRLTEHRGEFHEPSWSPDGQRLVFDACRVTGTPGPGALPRSALCIMNADGSNLTRLLARDPEDGWFPSWSPDGSRIAFQRGGSIYIVQPDGTDLTRILNRPSLGGTGDLEMFADQPVWSPDSRRIAFIASPQASQSTPAPSLLEYHFYVVSIDGTGPIKLATFKSAAHRAGHGWAAWSPDGKRVAVQVIVDDKGPAKHYQMNADGSGQLEEIGFIPESWYPWHWPQWDRSVTSPSSAVEQARAFAEPILQAIAGRKPEFEDDFSTDKGWLTDRQCGQIADGRLRTSIIPERMARQSDGQYTCGAHNPRVLNVANFVFEADLTQAQTGVLGGAGVQWRHTDGYYRVAVDVPGQRWVLVKSSTSQPGGVGLETLQEWQGVASGRIRVIARGNRFAVYINDKPVFYVQDDLNPTGEIDLWLNAPGGPLEVEYDNIKLWSLDNVSGLPAVADKSPQAEQARAFAEPILKAIANRKPDFADDFSAADKGWSIGTESRGYEGTAIQGGVARLRVHDGKASSYHIFAGAR